MFFKKRKRTPRVNPNAAAVNRIVICVLLVGYIVHAVKTHSVVPISNVKEIKDSIVNAAPDIPEGFFHYQNFLPSTPEAVTIQDTQGGSGEPAFCGQDVTVSYTVSDSKNPLPDKASKDKPLMFRIGGHKVMLALEQGVVGMKKGGKRLITSPPRMAYGERGFTRENMPRDTNVVFSMELLDTRPAVTETKENPFRLSDLQRGRGHAIICGTPVKAHITVWDKAGHKLFSTHDGEGKPFMFTAGSSQVFLGLDEGVIGMNAGGKRTLSVPPEFQKTLHGNAPAALIPFPDKQTVLVDVEAMP